MSNVPWSTSLLSLANAPSLSIVRRKAIRAPFERQGKPHWLTDAGPAAPVAPQRRLRFAGRGRTAPRPAGTSRAPSKGRNFLGREAHHLEEAREQQRQHERVTQYTLGMACG